MKTTQIKTIKINCIECNGTGVKSKCCVASVDKGYLKTTCKHCKQNCKTEDCLVCKGKGHVNILQVNE